MDPLTHTLTGLALSRAGLNRVTAHATPLLLLAANAPDIDVVALAWGALPYLHYHRHLTHAFAAVPLVALLPVPAVRLFVRKRFDWKRAYVVSFAGVATHPLLDWLNSYGIRFLLPFSGRWFRLDLVNLGDLWIWAALLVAALAPLLGRLVSSEIGAKPGSGRGWAVAALCFLAVYPFGRWLLHERAVEVLNARLYEGAAPVRVAAMPDSFNPLRWRGIVETPQAYSIHDVNLAGEFDPAGGRILYKPEMGERENAAARAARGTEAFRVFLDFSAYPYWRFAPAAGSEDAIRVEAMDLRFGAPPDQAFQASAVVDSAGRVRESRFEYRPGPER
ncbi:MAG: metal-dependent hydrolase [Acidobacteriota bacterium]